jgi:hypothetical protein
VGLFTLRFKIQIVCALIFSSMHASDPGNVIYPEFVVTPCDSGFGGLVVSMLASGTQDRTRPKPSDFSGEKIHTMPSFGGEVKPPVPCRRFAACKKTPATYVEVGIAGKIDRPFLAHNSVLH